jgi:hypothetical protein
MSTIDYYQSYKVFQQLVGTKVTIDKTMVAEVVMILGGLSEIFMMAKSDDKIIYVDMNDAHRIDLPD